MDIVKVRTPYKRESMFSKFSPQGNKKDQGFESEARLYRVLTAKELLISEKARVVLQQIETLAICPQKHYQGLYGDLINNFAEYCQIIPTEYGGRLGSLFNDSLEHALTALQIMREREKSKQEPTDPLLAYAIFSITLLRNLAHLLTDKKIFICNDQGHFIKEWQPFAGSLVSSAKYFKIRSYGADVAPALGMVTALLARQVMPPAAFLWLSEDPAILNLWLRAFMPGQGEDEDDGGIQLILALIIERIAHREQKPEMVAPPLIPLPIEYTEPADMAVAEAFLVWLKKDLAANSQRYNQENGVVYITGEGVYLFYSQLGEEFSRNNPDIGVLTQAAWNHLGVFPLSGIDLKTKRRFAQSQMNVGLGSQLFSQMGHGQQARAGSTAKEFVGPVDPRYLLAHPSKANVQTYLAARKPQQIMERFDAVKSGLLNDVAHLSVPGTHPHSPSSGRKR